jgi:enterochelin esterase-like enzyme
VTSTADQRTAASTSATPERVRPARLDRLVAELDRPGFWSDLARIGTPLVDPAPGEPDRREVTFLYRSSDDRPPMLALNGLPRDRPEEAALERVPGTDLWFAGYRLRSDHQATYRIADADRGPTAEPSSADAWRQRMLQSSPDPLNPQSLPGRWDQPPSSLLRLPDAPVPRWLHQDQLPIPAERRGSIEVRRVASRILDTERDVWIYRPPVDHDHELAVLVLCDGDRWFGDLGFGAVLDRMIADAAIEPLVVLAPDSVDLQTRWHDLAGHRPYLDFLADEVMGLVPDTKITTDPARTVIAGQSLGGLTALFGALSRPDRFGRVLAQSASLWWRPGLPPGKPHPEQVGSCWMAEQYAAADRLPAAVQLQSGRLEGDLNRLTEDVFDTLQRAGVRVERTRYTGGHDYAWWIGGMVDGLIKVLA